MVGGLILLALPGAKLQKWWALLVSLATFAVSCLLFVWWQNGEAGMQFVERVPWVPQFNIQYLVGVDGISLFLVLLTTLISVLVLIFSWEGVEKQLKSYLFLMLLLEAGMIGVFVSLDLVLFYVFWELTLIPMYFLIGGWGDPHGTYVFLGREMPWRIYAALKFFLYTLAGSALMLVGIIVLYYQGGTFDLMALQKMNLAANLQTWLFLAFALAFAIKVPIFPFHTWLPDAHVAAPTGGSVILAAVLLKMGTYGFVRLCLPLFPEATIRFTPWIAALALIGILYGALVALVQKDAKSLVAYSSVAHLGFVMLGIFALNAQGIAGATLQMVNHGLSTGALFLMVGMLYNRRHTRHVGRFRRVVEIDADLWLPVSDRRDVLGRAAGAERLCGRDQHPHRRVPDHSPLRHPGHARHHPGRLVSAQRGPPDAPRPAEQARERGDLRSETARGAGAGAARDPVLRHRPFPEHFL